MTKVYLRVPCYHINKVPFTPILSLWNSPLGEYRKADFPGGHPGGGSAPQTRPQPQLHLTGYRATWKRVLAPQIRSLRGAWKLFQPCCRGLGPPHPPRSGWSGEFYLSWALWSATRRSWVQSQRRGDCGLTPPRWHLPSAERPPSHSLFRGTAAHLHAGERLPAVASGVCMGRGGKQRCFINSPPTDSARPCLYATGCRGRRSSNEARPLARRTLPFWLRAHPGPASQWKARPKPFRVSALTPPPVTRPPAGAPWRRAPSI